MNRRGTLDELFDLVVDRPLDEKPSDKATCPWCRGANLTSYGRITTLLGGGDGTLDGDPNHVHHEMGCGDCGKKFMRETSSGKTWYTHEGRLLRGVPHCFEPYQYTCGHCSGAVRRHYTKLDGTPTGGLLWTSEGGKQYRTYFSCDSCQRKIETDAEYFY